MCGLTLLPRKVLPTIFLVLVSMNAISFESRFTIMTTDVGSVILTAGACAISEPVSKRVNELRIDISPHESANLARCLQTNFGEQIAKLAVLSRRIDHVLQRERQP